MSNLELLTVAKYPHEVFTLIRENLSEYIPLFEQNESLQKTYNFFIKRISGQLAIKFAILSEDPRVATDPQKLSKITEWWELSFMGDDHETFEHLKILIKGALEQYDYNLSRQRIPKLKVDPDIPDIPDGQSLEELEINLRQSVEKIGSVSSTDLVALKQAYRQYYTLVEKSYYNEQLHQLLIKLLQNRS